MPVSVGPDGRSYTLLSNSFTSAAAGTIISPSDGNAAHADYADAINTALTFAPVEGQRRVMGVQAYTATPPGSPISGQIWLVGTGATGAWSGKDKAFAVYRASGWLFYDPVPGDTAVIVSTRQTFIFDGSNVWQPGPIIIPGATTVGKFPRFADTAGAIGQSQTIEDGSGNLTIAGRVRVLGLFSDWSVQPYSTVTVANTAMINFAAGSGLITVASTTNGHTAAYLVGGGAIALLGQTGSSFVVGVPPNGYLGMLWTGSVYSLKNRTGATVGVSGAAIQCKENS